MSPNLTESKLDFDKHIGPKLGQVAPKIPTTISARMRAQTWVNVGPAWHTPLR